MNFLTLSYIKSHSRIDYDIEDDLLTLYGEAAEETVMNICNTTYEAMLEKYATIPSAIVQAALMLVDVSYTHRSPVSPVNLYAIPYTFDMLVKPYMILSEEEEEEEEE